MTFALVSDEGRELAMVSDVVGFFVPRAPEPQAWRTFELIGTSLEPGFIGNVELCVVDGAGDTIGAYYVATVEVDDVRASGVASGLVDARVNGPAVEPAASVGGHGLDAMAVRPGTRWWWTVVS